MFAQERLNVILEILEEEGRVRVKDLSQRFNLSEDAIRKDLQALDKLGRIERIYGGAILKKDVPEFLEVKDRTKHSEEKSKIAQKAFDEIQEHETVLLDISSINVLLANLIKNNNKKMTVISNSLDILQVLAHEKHVQLIALGGMMHDQVDGFVGNETIEAIKRYNVDRLFLGCVSIDVDQNAIATFNVEDGYTKAEFIKRAKKTILLAQNKKLNYSGVFNYTSLDEIDVLITEKNLNEETIKKLKHHHVTLK